MTCEIKRKEDGLLIKPMGDIDHHLSVLIREKIDVLIEDEGVKLLEFDFSNINFMDSSGVGLIMGRYKKIRPWGGKISVKNLKPEIKRIFEISGLFKLVDVKED